MTEDELPMPIKEVNNRFKNQQIFRDDIKTLEECLARIAMDSSTTTIYAEKAETIRHLISLRLTEQLHKDNSRSGRASLIVACFASVAVVAQVLLQIAELICKKTS